ncbi:serine protease [Streptomyces sp. NPDC004667]|uniref:S1 family peptidase n=1 Tax=Streptomyces sp. NPDC004667 TaxID=3154285 RepID=UPI0033B392A3
MSAATEPVPCRPPAAARTRRPRRTPVRVAVIGMVAALCATATSGGARAIVNGHDAAGPYPFMVSIPMTYVYGSERIEGVCGGSLIARDWVVTAAHCAEETATSHPAGTVRVGSERRHSGGTVRTIVEKVVHPGYDGREGRSHDDIALLRLDRPVPQQPIEIAARAPRVGADTRILGFGALADVQTAEDWVLSERLQELDTRSAAPTVCLGLKAADELCTTSREPGAMACYGDSGGPQIQRTGGRWRLVGATSGDGDHAVDPKCGDGPGIWTSVPAYRAWLDATMHGGPAVRKGTGGPPGAF